MPDDNKTVPAHSKTNLSREALKERERVLLAIVESPDSSVDEKVQALADLAFLSGTTMKSIS